MFSKIVSSFVMGVTAVFGGLFGDSKPAPVPQAVPSETRIMSETIEPGIKGGAPDSSLNKAGTPTPKIKTAEVILDTENALSDEKLLSLADNKYAFGNLPLGDDRYVTSEPKKGFVYLCNVKKENPGSNATGPWMHGVVWNSNEKISILGSVSWPQAEFSNVVTNESRTLSGNGLPLGHTTGVFPVSISDPAHSIDPNPNSILVQNIKSILPANPVYSETPYCMGGEVGIMLTGVPLFTAFDAGLRDAAAHEIQDSCDGHPQKSGEYHYHNLSSCFKDTTIKTVIGYAYDGFPITGPLVDTNKYLTTEDLDVCHGITSEIIVDGEKKVTYHYVMTQDFPYSASCFRGKPVTLGSQIEKPIGEEIESKVLIQDLESKKPQAFPPEAVTACIGKTNNSSCSIVMPAGVISGECHSLMPEGPLGCVPQR
jgi:hypothetical protein